MPRKAGAFGHAPCRGRRREAHTTRGEQPQSVQLRHGSPFAEQAGLRLVSVEEGRATVTLPVQPSSLAANGTIHRGAITALVEAAATAAALGPAETPSGDEGASELYVSFVRSAPQHPLNAEARIVSQAGSRKSCEVEVRDWNGELVAKGFLSCSM
jgi:uncharacterized protein (TIGR00369 family)